ncbi:unnamed protein product [Allacma fusca]|uniref:Uncharacterized protein n=1 Tax=Allacma fusca TaxID=39272 RepID=A0A8J2PE00_9HEXA|nr:unnamed protein product [Allacma fusca]
MIRWDDMMSEWKWTQHKIFRRHLITCLLKTISFNTGIGRWVWRDEARSKKNIPRAKWAGPVPHESFMTKMIKVPLMTLALSNGQPWILVTIRNGSGSKLTNIPRRNH